MRQFPRVLSIIVLAVVTLTSTPTFSLSSKPFSKIWKDIKPEVIPDPRHGALNAINLVNALASGNSQQVQQVLGQTLLNSPGCLACTQIAKMVAPKLSNDQIDRIAGEGILTYLTDGGAVLDMLDPSPGAGDVVEQRLATPQDAPPPLPPGPHVRQAQTYSGQPECILEHNGTVWAGWKAPAVLSNGMGQPFTFPKIDLVSGDTIELTSRGCTEWNNSGTGAEALAAAEIKFESQTSVATQAEGMIWFYLVGKIAETHTGPIPTPSSLLPSEVSVTPNALPSGMSLTCKYTYGLKAGQIQNFAGVPGAVPAAVGAPCGDGQGSFGITQ
jgi:hypothetical protein